MRDGALLLRVRLRWDDEVRESGRIVLEAGDRDDEGAGKSLAPALRVRMRADRVGIGKQEEAQLV